MCLVVVTRDLPLVLIPQTVVPVIASKLIYLIAGVSLQLNIDIFMFTF